MKRVVITGLGVVSCIGNNQQEVSAALQAGTSGIRFNQSFADVGMRSQIGGMCEIDLSEHIDRKAKRFMGDAAGYATVAMQQAIADAGLEENLISHDRTGVIAGSGTGSPENTVRGADVARERGVKRIGPYAIPQTMGSTVSACLANTFKIRGINYSITSACATSVHCIGAAMEQIQWGKQDIIFAGGGEELHWSFASMFDAMGALSTQYNDSPETASRPYNATRDGFVISSGGGILVLEEYEHAKARGANIYAELTGYVANSDGYDMVAPSGEGAARCMTAVRQGLSRPIDYINTHGTSTPVGDIRELEAIRSVFGSDVPPISSTKSQTGHSLGATGVHESIYCLLMMQGGFISPTINLTDPDPGIEGFDIVAETREAELNSVMTNSFGFGGTNACVVMEKV